MFAATHGTLLRLLREGVIDGLRIDHPDGLADPGGYLGRLHAATGGRWTVVEKVLGADERLPGSWACAGTTGYDALRHIDALFVCPQGAGRLFAHYRDFATPLADEGGDWEETVRRAAYEVVTHDLAAEVERLVRTAVRILSLIHGDAGRGGGPSPRHVPGAGGGGGGGSDPRSGAGVAAGGRGA